MKGSFCWVGSHAAYGVGEIDNCHHEFVLQGGEGFMMRLCRNWTVSLSRSLLEDLMWQRWVR